MRSFPLPVRVAAGLAATTFEQTRRLPTCVIGLPVTVASQALQVSMRIQQQVTELAIKGDEALSVIQPPEDQPAWATFDEDPPAPPARSAFDRTPAEESAVDEPAGFPEESVTDESVTGEPEIAAPSALPGYPELTLPQLRGKLRGLSEDGLAELLRYERSGQQRPDFLRMLSNRLERVRSAN